MSNQTASIPGSILDIQEVRQHLHDLHVHWFTHSRHLPPAPQPRKPRTARKISTTLRLSSEVLHHFKATGPGWQTRINQTLLNTVRTELIAAATEEGRQ